MPKSRNRPRYSLLKSKKRTKRLRYILHKLGRLEKAVRFHYMMGCEGGINGFIQQRGL